MRSILFLGVLGGLLAGCSAGSNNAPTGASASVAPAHALPSVFKAPAVARGHSTIASLPDRGDLVAYAGSPALQQGAETWHAVQLSEAHALRAIGDGGMVVNAPNGQPIRLKYERFVEHPDGNWSWIGRPDGSPNAPEAVLTFGEKAVFGSIPFGNQPALQVQTRAGRTWMVESDPRKLAAQPVAAPTDTDMLTAPMASAARLPAPASAAAPAMAASGGQTLTATSSSANVDLVLGYSSGLKTRLGGTSQVNTRLNFIVDLANQALSNSRVGGRLRLLHTVEVDYADDTTNRSALFELSGQQCTNTPVGTLHLPDGDVDCDAAAVPAALAPLVAARAKYGADLVSLVRDYQAGQQTCGVAWLIGGGQQTVTAASAAFGFSVISDSAGGACRSETLAHELGHNFGLAHDRDAAAGSDDSDTDGDPLDANEYGRFAYSFGYKTAAFYTVMSLPGPGLTAYRVFANPRINTCGGAPCGMASESDNARTLAQTMPVVATFRTSRTQYADVRFSGDFNGDGRSDIFWRNSATGANIIWLSGDASTQQTAATVSDTNWSVEGVGDFNGDGKADIFWRNTSTGSNVIWDSGNANTYRTIATVSAAEWTVVGTGDFNGDGHSDLLWRNGITGGNLIWRSANPTTQQHVSNVSDSAWTVAAVGDFDGDHKADIFWRNAVTGADTIWRSGNSATVRYASPVTDTAWVVAGAGDFNGDGKADVLWRNSTTGQDIVWDSGSASSSHSLTSVTDTSWNVVGFGDFNGDHKADFFWRNAANGSNVIWRSGDSASWLSVPGVTNMEWIVAG